MYSTFSSQTSRENQVNLNSYANTFISSNFLFRIQNPLKSPHPIHLSSLNRLLPYLAAQELTIQGRGYCHNHKEGPSSIGVAAIPTWDQVGANWPHHILMANLAPSGALWNFGHIPLPCPFMPSGHILPSLASLANSSISPTPGLYPCFWAWGCPFVS
ncbi:hypothetical protein O181_113885 [Austropuccinia psidii MF-1]|uniref:Uncharacterized protein n=1 Tax=Austropuccinia psidii MF-1 TaxID=1389203 RepID=A0A9Q3K3E1_9BASI|nr:hypothetical protein [Austropuccinia psidii MF-1]